MAFLCTYCNKQFKSYQSRWNHIRNFHNSTVREKVSESKDVGKEKVSKSKVTLYECRYCNKIYKHKQTRFTHEKNCKECNNNNKLINIVREQNNQIQELKDMLLKALKIHPKTLQKINNQLNMNNNGIINNNFIIQLGYEDFNKVLSENEKIGLLNKHSNSVIEMVKMVHVNPNKKYKQYKSMYITNLQNNVAYKYDDTCKKFIAVSKMDLLDSIIDTHINFYEDYKDKITPFTSNNIQKFLDKISNEKDYKDVKKEELKFAIYNGREEIINQIKENNPDLNIFI